MPAIPGDARYQPPFGAWKKVRYSIQQRAKQLDESISWGLELETRGEVLLYEDRMPELRRSIRFRAKLSYREWLEKKDGCVLNVAHYLDSSISRLNCCFILRCSTGNYFLFFYLPVFSKAPHWSS